MPKLILHKTRIAEITPSTKLFLNKETLRQLDQGSLLAVRAGRAAIPFPLTPYGCPKDSDLCVQSYIDGSSCEPEQEPSLPSPPEQSPLISGMVPIAVCLPSEELGPLQPPKYPYY
jgi:hypothetical protein